MDQPHENQVEAQLRVLGELDAILSSAGARFWLRGGWAIDFLLGEVTRSHADLDLVAWACRRKRIKGALADAGFELTRDTEVQTDWRRSGVEISSVFLERTRDGQVAGYGVPGWVWREDALPPQRLSLRGFSCRVVGPRQLLDEKEGYERGTGRPLRPKDLESIETLKRLTS